ncbi:60S ribosomal L24 protein [Fusarium globosum]|uniref:60S ribosomal L24 protein n=1 Tax=Fusarium globosum TaxID=78864 RepID=A0A8H6DIF3_9HYPO|nr:60S ribosomal L24 protein [Fusarium globosum]
MRTYEDTFSGARIYPGKSLEGDDGDDGSQNGHSVFINQDIKRLTGIASQGKLYVRGDSKIFRFQNGKSESLFLQRKNPRRIAWTVLYRRQHRKGISEEVAKKRTRRTVKAQRGIVGASLDVIKEKRNIRPEARSAARAQAIKESKEKKQADAAAKKSEKAKLAAQASKGQAVRQVSKQGAKGSAPKVQAKSR